MSAGATLGGLPEVIRAEVRVARERGHTVDWIIADEGPLARAASLILHRAFYGAAGEYDSKALRLALTEYYEDHEATVSAASENVDVVFFHDPLGLALSAAVPSSKTVVVWRCHIGTSDVNSIDSGVVELFAESALRPDLYVFSDDTFVWPFLRRRNVLVAPPGIDEYSLKNRELSDGLVSDSWGDLVSKVLGEFVDARSLVESNALFDVDDAATGRPPVLEPFVLQVARWDQFKGHVGVVRAFALIAREFPDLHLILVGPRIDDAYNYPSDRTAWRAALGARKLVPSPERERIHIWCFRCSSRAAEDVLLNIIRTRAAVVVQNSERESYGLTVGEAVWKRKPVVASDVKGIRSQLEGRGSVWLVPYTISGESWMAAMLSAVTEAGELPPERGVAKGYRRPRSVVDSFNEQMVAILPLIES